MQRLKSSFFSVLGTDNTEFIRSKPLVLVFLVLNAISDLTSF